jgi:predicted lipoprotein with Yx(FWY)xxD motif
MLNNNRSTATSVATGPAIIASAATLAILAAFAVLLLHATAGNAAMAKAATAKGAIVSTESTSLGRILVDGHGQTLYMFGKDQNDKSACTGQCAGNWPPLLASGKPSATGGAKESLLGTTKRPNGQLQVTYNHHPLYTFAKDTKKGQTNGQGVNAFGATWHVVSPAGASITKPASSGGGGGGGYNP